MPVGSSIPSRWHRPPRVRGARLTDDERRWRALSEADFQRQVTDLATALGWTWCHWRPLRNGRGIWQVPVEGPLGRGWPDLTLVRVRDRRLVFAELKREDQDPEPHQVAVLELLDALGPDDAEWPRDWRELGESVARLGLPRVEAHVWRPSDLADPWEESVIGRCLR